MLDYKISNIAATANLLTDIDLSYLARNAINIEYNPDKHNTAVLRIRKPKATCVMFESGRFNILGTQTLEDARKAALRFARIVQKNFKYKYIRCLFFRLTNIVIASYFHFRIHLENLYNCEKWKYKMDYDPMKFPAIKLYFNPYSSSVVGLIFRTGKIVITGASSLPDLENFGKEIFKITANYKLV